MDRMKRRRERWGGRERVEEGKRERGREEVELRGKKKNLIGRNAGDN